MQKLFDRWVRGTGLACLLAPAGLHAGNLPSWWLALPKLERMESEFVQTSDSAVFGSIKRSGKIQLARGGRLRVAYASGLLLLCDGRSLIQYDPGARTAQKTELRAASEDMPLLNVLVDVKAVETTYRLQPVTNEKLKLEPKRKGIPAVELEGKGGFLRRIQWMDTTGAKQVLELQHPRTPASIPAQAFSFAAPTGTRWIGKH